MKLGNLLLLIGIMCLMFCAPVLLAQQPSDEAAEATETAAAPVFGPGLNIGVVDIDGLRYPGSPQHDPGGVELPPDAAVLH